MMDIVMKPTELIKEATERGAIKTWQNI